MPSLNLDLNYPDHPKTKRLVAILGKASEFLPVKLWLYAGRVHPENGKLGDLSELEIEAIVGWEGEPGAFISAMERVEWLIRDENNHFQLLGWKDHQGHLIVFKIRSEKASKARWGKYKTRHASSNPKPKISNATSNAPTVLTVPAVLAVQEGVEAPPPPAATTPEEIVEAWNSQKELPAVRSISVGRRTTIIRRLKDPTWRADWRAAISRAAGSKFLKGENDRGWRADFDWFLQADAVTKIMEGRYDNRNQTHAGINKPNARNFGIAGDQEERSRRVVETLERRQREAQAAAANGVAEAKP